MWKYEKRLEFPVNIKEPNAKMAMFIMSQYGGPKGKYLWAGCRYWGPLVLCSLFSFAHRRSNPSGSG